MIRSICNKCDSRVVMPDGGWVCAFRYRELFPSGFPTVAAFPRCEIENREFLPPAKCPYRLEHLMSEASNG